MGETRDGVDAVREARPDDRGADRRDDAAPQAEVPWAASARGLGVQAVAPEPGVTHWAQLRSHLQRAHELRQAQRSEHGSRTVVVVDLELVGRLAEAPASSDTTDRLRALATEGLAPASLPDPAALGAVDDPDLTRRAAGALGQALGAAGADVLWAPELADVAAVAASFGGDPVLVGVHLAAWRAGISAAGVAVWDGVEATLCEAPADAPALDEALAAVRAVGVEAARRALRTTGGVALTGPPLVFDLRGQSEREVGRPLVAALRQGWVATEVLVPISPEEVAAALDVAPVAHDVVILTDDDALDSRETALRATVLAARPHALLVHTGSAETAPTADLEGDAVRMICTHGRGAANATALVAALGPASSPGGAL